MSGGGLLGQIGAGALGPLTFGYNLWKGDTFTSSEKSSPPAADTPPPEPAPTPKTRQQLIAEQYAKQRASVYSTEQNDQTLGSKSLLGNA
jgi:hypothetical protein